MKRVKSKKNKDKIRRYGKKEFLFNVISLSIIIFIGIYFGCRSIYYYTKERVKTKEVANTLAGEILANNKVTKDTNGLHQEDKGYIFKGIVDTNYVSFAGRLFRVMEVYNNTTVKIISEDSQGLLIWGEESNYSTSNLYNWLNKTDKAHSGIFYNSVANIDEFVVKTSWCEGVMDNDRVSCSKTNKDLVSSLTITDYVNSLGKSGYLNNKKNNWLIGKDKDGNNLYVDSEGRVGITTTNEAYGTRAVLTLKKGLVVSKGTGTLGDPYVINQDTKTNDINKYVKLGEDIWKVYEINDNIYRLSLNNYLQVRNEDYLTSYSSNNSLYNPLNRYNIAYYLNRTFYNSLSYKNILSECTFYTGEISSNTNLDYENMYSSSISNKVGLLNLFDLNTNTELSDYYLMNTTSSVGSMVWVYNNNLLLTEAKVTEKKKVIPTICFDKNLIKSGEGSLNNPYTVE